MKQKAKAFLKHPLFSGSALMIGGSLGINAVNYLYHLIMGRLMGPETYGALGSIFSILYIVSIVPISTSYAIVKYVSSAKSEKEQYVIYESVKKLVFKLAVGISLVVFVAAPFVSKFLHLSENISLMMVAGIVFFNLLTLVNKATLQGILKFAGVIIPDIVTSVVKLLLGVALVYIGYQVLGAVAAVLLASMFAYFASVAYTKHTIKVYAKAPDFDTGAIVKFALPVLIQSLAFTSFFSADLLLVRHFLPEVDAGLYAALSTLGKIIFFAAQPITSVMFPIVAGRRSRGDAYRNIFFLSALVTVGFSMVIIIFYYLFPQLAIGVLYGAEYLRAANELVLMGVFIALYSLCNLLVNFSLSLHKTKVVIYPLVVAVLQIVIVWEYHASIAEVISVNIWLSAALLASLVVYLGYYELKRKKYAQA